MKKGNFIILGSSMQANAYFPLLNSVSGFPKTLQ